MKRRTLQQNILLGEFSFWHLAYNNFIIVIHSAFEYARGFSAFSRRGGIRFQICFSRIEKTEKAENGLEAVFSGRKVRAGPAGWLRKSTVRLSIVYREA